MTVPASSTVRSMLAATAGLAVYGLWAFVVNYDHGIDAGIRAALVQGGYSFALTFCMTWLMERLYTCLRPRAHAAWIASGITMVLLFATAWCINRVARTPEILATIMPGFVIGSIYTIVYMQALDRLSEKSSKDVDAGM